MDKNRLSFYVNLVLYSKLTSRVVLLKKVSSHSPAPKETSLGEMPVICCLQHKYCSYLAKSGLQSYLK